MVTSLVLLKFILGLQPDNAALTVALVVDGTSSTGNKYFYLYKTIGPLTYDPPPNGLKTLDLLFLKE